MKSNDDHSNVSLAALSRAWLRATPPDLVSDGDFSPWQLELSFASQAATTTLPALLAYDVVMGATPWACGLDYLTNAATQLQASGYSLHNTYIIEAMWDAQASPLAALWATQTPKQFVDAMYGQIFGHAPLPDGEAWLVHDVAYYSAEFGSDIAGKGATIGGMLALKTQTPYTAGPNYIAAASAMLHADASGHAAWGSELIASYGR